jgi:hypothetical protein
MWIYLQAVCEKHQPFIIIEVDIFVRLKASAAVSGVWLQYVFKGLQRHSKTVQCRYDLRFDCICMNQSCINHRYVSFFYAALSPSLRHNVTYPFTIISYRFPLIIILKG